MTTSDIEISKAKPTSALSELAKLPKVGALFGGDIGLGFAHNYALDVARDILNDVPKEERKELYLAAMKILYQWQDDHGKPATLLSHLFGNREDNITEQERKESIKGLEPWQCHPYATTSIALFKSIYEYKPLKDFFEKVGWRKYDYIKALLILDSNNTITEFQTSDCILAAIELAKSKLEDQRDLIKSITPLANSALTAKFNSKKTRRIQKEQKEKHEDELVHAAYKELCPNGERISAIQQRIMQKTNLKQTAISNSMARLKLPTRKSKNNPCKHI